MVDIQWSNFHFKFKYLCLNTKDKQFDKYAFLLLMTPKYTDPKRIF